MSGLKIVGDEGQSCRAEGVTHVNWASCFQHVWLITKVGVQHPRGFIPAFLPYHHLRVSTAAVGCVWLPVMGRGTEMEMPQRTQKMSPIRGS